VDRLFGGHLLSSIVCTQCNQCVQRVEPFLDLSLPIFDESKAHSSVSCAVKNNQLKKTKLPNLVKDIPKYIVKNEARDENRNDQNFYKNSENEITNDDLMNKKSLSKYQGKKLRKNAVKQSRTKVKSFYKAFCLFYCNLKEKTIFL
jgi:hypothetical protein